MIDADPADLGWELIGWEGDDHAAHRTELTLEEVLRVRHLFPDRNDDLLASAVHDVPPALYAGMRAAVPRLEFRGGLDYQLGGYRLPA